MGFLEKVGLFRKIAGTVSVGILSASLFVSYLIDREASEMSRLIDQMDLQNRAMEQQGLIDMMHEGLIGDVYLAIAYVAAGRTGEADLVRERVNRHAAAMEGGLNEIRGLRISPDVDRAIESVTPLITGYIAKVKAATEAALNGDSGADAQARDAEQQFAELETLLGQLASQLAGTSRQTAAGVNAIKQTQRMYSYGLVFLALAVSSILYFFLAIFAPRRMMHQVRDVVDASTSTRVGADQLKATSSFLAENASRQASTVEEISAAIQELNGQTTESAGHAVRSLEAGARTKDRMESAWTRTQDLLRQMSAIKSSGEQVSRFTRTIDEVAFQTNILSLNASVEAARAGSAGLGFAIVADEVRNLASKTSASSREIASRIEESLASIRTGEQLNAEVGDGIDQVRTDVIEVDQLLRELYSRLNEAARGLDELAKAIESIDKNTQNIAAASEETASMVQELITQADRTERAVDELRRILGEA